MEEDTSDVADSSRESTGSNWPRSSSWEVAAEGDTHKKFSHNQKCGTIDTCLELFFQAQDLPLCGGLAARQTYDGAQMTTGEGSEDILKALF